MLRAERFSYFYTIEQAQFISRLSDGELELFTADLIDAVDQLIQEWSK